MQVNPIVKKDLKVLSRSMKIAWAVFAYEAVLGVVFLFALSILTLSYRYRYGYLQSYSELQFLFPIIGGTEVGIVALIMPIMTASAISGEKERQTFDILLTTPMKTFNIILGKNLSALLRVMVFIVASIPIMAVSFTLGGLNWIYLFIYLIGIMVFAFFAGAIGIFASTFTRKSIVAIIISYVMYSGFYGITYVPLMIAAILDSVTGGVASDALLVFSGVALLINPVMFFIELFWVMLNEGEGMVAAIFDSFSVNFFINDIVWLIASAIIIIGIAILIMYFSSRIIDPIKGKNTRK